MGTGAASGAGSTSPALQAAKLSPDANIYLPSFFESAFNNRNQELVDHVATMDPHQRAIPLDPPPNKANRPQNSCRRQVDMTAG